MLQIYFMCQLKKLYIYFVYEYSWPRSFVMNYDTTDQLKLEKI